jgi:phosphoserine phosphatase
MIEPIADSLGIPAHHIYANTLLFHPFDGSFLGFDDMEPTSRDGGKAAVVNILQDVHGHERVVMVGDGVTDLQARPPAQLFIGFGGVHIREKVKDGADWFITDFQVSFRLFGKNGSLTDVNSQELTAVLKQR